MDSSTNKLYHKHDFDSRQFLEHYCSDKPEMGFGDDSLLFPIENLTKTFTEGRVKGDLLIDLSIGSMVHHLYSACEFFKDIIVLKVSDRCIMELKSTGAFHWGHATKLHTDMQGNSDESQDKEEKLRSAIQHVMKCDLRKENIMDPLVLPLADCIISAWLLDVISTNQVDYIKYLGKFSGLLKPGGHLILIGDLDATYFTVGKDKFHMFKYDEDFVRKALIEVGFTIDSFELRTSTFVSDLTNYKAVVFIVAHKEK